jgi:hypothetical protein
VSVVSELRELATDLEKRAEALFEEAKFLNERANGIGPDASHRRKGLKQALQWKAEATGLRMAAQAARLRALRAETSVLARTDERPRFAQLRAPQRPSATTAAVNLGAGATIDFDGSVMLPGRCEIGGPHSPSCPEAVGGPHQPWQVFRIDGHELPPNCEPYSCDGCGRAGVWHRGVLTFLGVPAKRYCKTCKAKGLGVAGVGWGGEDDGW